MTILCIVAFNELNCFLLFQPSSKEGTKAFMKIIRNNLSKKHCNKFKPRYLPISGGEADQPFRAQWVALVIF